MLLHVPGAHGSCTPDGHGWSRFSDQKVNQATLFCCAKPSRLSKVAWVNNSLGWSVCPFIKVIPRCDQAVAADQLQSDSSCETASAATVSSALTWVWPAGSP